MTIDLHCHPSLKSYLFNRRFKNDNPSGAGDNPLEYMFRDMLTDLPKLQRGGVSAILSAVYVPERAMLDDCTALALGPLFSERFRHCIDRDPWTVTNEVLDHFEDEVDDAAASGQPVRVAKSVVSLDAAIANGELAVVHAIEGAHSLGLNLPAETLEDRIDALFERGVAMMTLAHFYDNDLVSPAEGLPPNIRQLILCTSKKDLTKGVTEKGERAIEKMIECGMLIDLTHTTPAAREDAIRINDRRSPLLLSHVGLCSNPMNATPDDIRAIAECGGAVGVILNYLWLRCRGPFPIFGKDNAVEAIVDTLGLIMYHGGVETAAIGSDLDGFTDPPDDLKDISYLPRIRAELERRKYSSDTIDKIMGENALRVLRSGWKKVDD